MKVSPMRCFAALELSEEARKKLSEIISEAKALGLEASFVKAEQLHVTLAFLGEISEEEAGKKIEALKTLEFPAFDLEIKGLGFFPNEDFIRVFWAGCESSELRALQEKVAELVGLKKEREFTEHLTLARIRGRKNIDALKALKEKHANDSFCSFRAKTVSFKKSTLTPQGPVYEDLAAVELVG